MKIIDLLNERLKLQEENTRFPFDALFLPAGCSEEDRKINREHKDKVKRYNELSDRINEVCAKTRIAVEGYGELSLATALEYYVSGSVINDADDNLLNLLTAEDYPRTSINVTTFGLFDDFTAPLGMPMTNNDVMEKRREKQDKIDNLQKAMIYDLQAAIITAISNTEV